MRGFLEQIRPGDRVIIRTASGRDREGRAITRTPGGWVLNLSGPHPAQAVADESNVRAVLRKEAAPTAAVEAIRRQARATGDRHRLCFLHLAGGALKVSYKQKSALIQPDPAAGLYDVREYPELAPVAAGVREENLWQAVRLALAGPENRA